jgi:hypothetical protein
MNCWAVNPAAVLVIGIVFCAASPAQEPGCVETSAMGQMARATTIASLKARKVKAGDSYRAQVIYAARLLEIDPRNKLAAELLLNLIPKSSDDSHHEVWLELDELDRCPSGGVPDSDLTPLFHLQYHLPRLLARAVLLVPDKMLDYVAFARDSLYPDSDYALQMRRVCRTQHTQFVRAISQLPASDKDWFVKEIFNPKGCQALALPER